MSTLSAALAAQRLMKQDATWALLRLDTAWLALAILGSHFSRERRQVSAAELHEAMEEDLISLRDHGLEVRQSAAAYTHH